MADEKTIDKKHNTISDEELEKVVGGRQGDYFRNKTFESSLFNKTCPNCGGKIKLCFGHQSYDSYQCTKCPSVYIYEFKETDGKHWRTGYSTEI